MGYLLKFLSILGLFMCSLGFFDQHQFSYLNASVQQDLKPEVKILVYDNIRGYLNWMQDWFRRAAETNCNTVCKIVESKNTIDNVDVVLFHGPTHTHDFPQKRRQSRTSYALISLEQPRYAKILANKDQLRKFDLLMTYSLQPFYPGTVIRNMPLTYYPLNILSTDAVMQPPLFSFSAKDGYGTGVSVALFTSNCRAAGATGRFAYIKELMKHIEIHSYGKCLNNRAEPEMPNDPKWPAAAQRRARKVKVLSHYKFYLAFENLEVDDYVSEKVYEGLFAATVPVYKGSPSIHRFMPSNDSFIFANALTPQQLADKLRALAVDQNAYEKFFEFKSRQLSTEFQKMAEMSYCHPNVLCRLCDYAVKRRERAARED